MTPKDNRFVAILLAAAAIRKRREAPPINIKLVTDGPAQSKLKLPKKEKTK